MSSTNVSPATGQDGTFTIKDVAPGRYTIFYYAPGNDYYFGEYPSRVSVAAGQTKNIGLLQLVRVPTFDATADLPQNIPVVLVRGRGAVESPDNTWRGLHAKLNSASFVNIWDPNENNGSVLNGTKGIDANAAALVAYIGNQVKAYRDAPANTKHSLPPHINFVAHSMGGLIVRRAMNNHSYITCPVDGANQNIPVKQVVMLGTPNAGTVLSDIGKEHMWFRWVPGFGIGSAGIVGFTHPEWDSSANLTTDYILNHFNASYVWPSSVPCFRMAGTGGMNSTDSGLRRSSEQMVMHVGDIEPEMVVDGAVSRPSVSGQYYTDKTNFIQSQLWAVDARHDATDVQAAGLALDHYDLTSFWKVQEWVVKILQTGAMPSGGLMAMSFASGNIGSFSNLSGTVSTFSETLPTSQFDERVGSLAQGGSTSLVVASDASSKLVVNLTADDGGMGFSLNDPAGTEVNSSTPASNPGVTFSQDADPTSGMMVATYTIANPAAGNWTVTLNGTALAQASAGYEVTVSGDSGAVMQPTTDPFFHNGRDAVISCSLMDTRSQTPVAGASITAQILFPDGTTATQSLLDDGLNGDTAPGDGIYAAVLPSLAQQGKYFVIYRASGTNAGGLPYSRYSTGVFNVSTDHAAIAGNFSSMPVAAGIGTSAPSVLVNCWVTAADPGNYRLTGQLVDSSGQIVIPASTSMDNVAAGTTTATLEFDLTAFQNAGYTGPATLTNLHLFEQTGSGLEWLDGYSDTYTVNIGPNITSAPASQSIEEGTAASLSVAADSGTYQWNFNGSPIAGATGATLTLSTITAALVGNYSVTVTNETGAVTTSPATLTVSPATSFAHWQQAKFTAAQLADPAVSSATADPVKSGTSNLLKYAFNGNPFTKDASILPASAAEASAGSTYLTFSYRQRLASTDLTYSVEVSDDLKTWDASGTQVEFVAAPIPTGDGVTQQVKVRVKTPMASLPKKFIRLRVTR